MQLFLVKFLDFVLQVLPVNKHGRYIYGMLAFALLELGRYAEAKEAAKKGFEIDSEDAWTHHAVSYSCLQVTLSFLADTNTFVVLYVLEFTLQNLSTITISMPHYQTSWIGSAKKLVYPYISI